MRVVSVVGARPQFIKAWAFSRACASAAVVETIIHTGQHYDPTLSALFFKELEIPEPWLNLGVGSSTASRQIADIMRGLETALARIEEPPDWVVVFGDTNSTLAAALTVVKKGFRLVHAEAGLRSYNRAMPEEVNRVMVDRVSDVLFCPNPHAVANLRAEGITEGVHEAGDLMYDALRLFAPLARRRYDPSEISGVAGRYGLVTIHRAENTDDRDRLEGLMAGLARVDMQLVWPVHPRTSGRLSEFGIQMPGNVSTLDPVGYLQMLSLIANAEVVLTDSGGVQREAYWLDRPCVTLREETEWTETLHGNWNQLVGSSPEALADALRKRPVGATDKPSTESLSGEKMIRVLLDAV